MTANIDREVRLPDAPPIAGLHFRTFDPDRDYKGLVALIREAHLADGIDWIPTVENLRAEHEHGGEFDPRRDLLVALVDGRTGGRTLGSWPDEAQSGAVALYESEGYSIARYGFMMVRDLTEPIADLPLPDGLDMRPVIDADHRRIWDADAEAFRDHWNAGERTEADFEGWFASPELDTSLWRVAWDGDEVAGSVMNFIYPAENEALGGRRGWLDHVSVGRPWRRRGLASALIAESMRALRNAGMTEAALGVDAENPTGALHVYENLGFRRARTGVQYRKPI